MKLKHLALALAIFGFSSGAAMAESSEWSGFYVGATFGNADGRSDVDTSTIYSGTGYFATTSVPAIAATGSGNVDPHGVSGGLTFGYNGQLDNLVFGLEADYNTLDADDSRTAVGTYPCCAPTGYTITEQTKASDLFTVRGRLGYAHNRSLFYVTAGWAQADIKINDTFDDNFATAHESFSGSETANGLIYGLGYEQGFASNWSMKIEYLYTDLGSVSGTSNNLTSNNGTVSYPTSTFTHTADLKLDMIRIGFNYRF